MAKTLVIVESPTKARTIERILKDGYEVLASYGHVRDLPESASEIPEEIKKKKWGRLGVDTDGDFTPYYVIPNDKKKTRPGAARRAEGPPHRSTSRPTRIARARRSAGTYSRFSNRRCRSSASSSMRSPRRQSTRR